MRKSSAEVTLEKRDKKVLKIAKDFVRLHGFTVPHGTETIDELNELINKDGLKLVVDFIDNGPDKIVEMYQNNKVVREQSVLIDTDGEIL